MCISRGKVFKLVAKQRKIWIPDLNDTKQLRQLRNTPKRVAFNLRLYSPSSHNTQNPSSNMPIFTKAIQLLELADLLESLVSRRVVAKLEGKDSAYVFGFAQ